MTIQEAAALNDEELTIKVSEAIGWKWMPGYYWYLDDKHPAPTKSSGLPNYPRDLNACHEAINSLGPTSMARLCEVCLEICKNSPAPFWLRAGARQVSEALLVALTS